MRVRKRAGAEELVQAHPEFVVAEPTAWKGRWKERFGNDHHCILKSVWEKAVSLPKWLKHIRKLIILASKCKSVWFPLHWIN